MVYCSSSGKINSKSDSNISYSYGVDFPILIELEWLVKLYSYHSQLRPLLSPILLPVKSLYCLVPVKAKMSKNRKDCV